MKLLKASLGIVLFQSMISIGLEGALPPVYESIRELQALIDSPELVPALEGVAPITEIQRRDNRFIVVTPNKTIEVTVVYQPVDHPGPAKFYLDFHHETTEASESSPFAHPDVE